MKLVVILLKSIYIIIKVINIGFSKFSDNTDEYTTVRGYNTRDNYLTITKKSLQELQEISKSTSNPEDFFLERIFKNFAT